MRQSLHISASGAPKALTRRTGRLFACGSLAIHRTDFSTRPSALVEMTKGPRLDVMTDEN